MLDNDKHLFTCVNIIDTFICQFIFSPSKGPSLNSVDAKKDEHAEFCPPDPLPPLIEQTWSSGIIFLSFYAK
jgi:hypothetical protein